MSRRCRWPASETLHITGSQLIADHFVGAFFRAKASKLYEQRPARFSSRHNMAPIAFLGAYFWIDGREQT
jgi:hypothetical protein